MMKFTENRQLHILDIENLLGDPRPSQTCVVDAIEHYMNVTHYGEGDLLVAACNHGAALAVGCALGGRHRLLLGSGPNGADYALLEVLMGEALPSRLSRVVIGSGDGIFAESAAQLSRLGTRVTVVSRTAALSARLNLAAAEVIYFDPATDIESAMEVAA